MQMRHQSFLLGERIHQAGIDLDNLYIKRVTVDDGPRGWRIRPRAQGRANWIKKSSSHVTVVLDER